MADCVLLAATSTPMLAWNGLVVKATPGFTMSLRTIVTSDTASATVNALEIVNVFPVKV